MTKPILTFSVVALACAAGAQSLPAIHLAASAGLYFPASSEIRDLFGATHFSFGIQPWNDNRTARNGFSPEIDVISGSGNGNRFLVVPVAIAFERDANMPLSPRSIVPYIRASAGVAYFDYSITRSSGAHYGLKRLGGALGIETGVKFSKVAKAYVKYDWVSTEQHFDFSGLELGAVVSFGSL